MSDQTQSSLSEFETSGATDGEEDSLSAAEIEASLDVLRKVAETHTDQIERLLEAVGEQDADHEPRSTDLPDTSPGRMFR